MEMILMTRWREWSHHSIEVLGDGECGSFSARSISGIMVKGYQARIQQQLTQTHGIFQRNRRASNSIWEDLWHTILRYEDADRSHI